MAQFLVTGGCGFIGSHLVDALVDRGDKVRVLDDLSTGHRQNIPTVAELVVGDVADPEGVMEAMRGVDGCFHLAAIASVQRSNEAWAATHRVNVGGTVCVLDAARTARTPVVFASSAAVYGPQLVDRVDESAHPRPITAYGVDKLASEMHASIASRLHEVPTLGLRFFNVYGSRQDPSSPYSGVISIFAHRIQRGMPIELHGDGMQVRDFIHVSDIVRLLLAGMERVKVEPLVLNACTGQPTTIRALAMLVGELCGHEPRIRSAAARPGDIRRSLGTPETARMVLGVQADILLRDGLRRTLNSLAPESSAHGPP
jgi:UDP-glucose 4-epimerase